VASAIGRDLGRTIGRIGVWTSTRQWSGDASQSAEAAVALETLGFGAVWLGSSTADLDVPRSLLADTERLVVATGIVNIWTNPAATVAANHRALVDAFPGRFLLGLGSSHAVLTEPATGEPYVRPYSRLVSYLDALDAAPHPVPVSERVLAALGPRTLELAAARSAGAHPYLVTPEHTATARKILGPGVLLAPEQKVIIEPDQSAARAAGRRSLAIYMSLPNYLNNLRRLGFDDADFADGGSDRLVDALVVWGSADAVKARVEEHFDAGADHVALQALTTGDPRQLPVQAWRELAGSLIG